MNDKEINKLIEEALRDDRELPQGLSNRLEHHIDQLAADEKVKGNFPTRKRSIYWFTGIAASLLLGVAIFFQVERSPITNTMADTFNDPKEAALVAQDALALLSTQFNKGLDQASEASKEVDRINTIVNKQFEALSVQP